PPVPLPHHHELRRRVPERPQSHQGDRQDQGNHGEALGLMDRLTRDRLHWKSRRGLLELDLVLQRFIPILKDEDVQPLNVLLDLPDNDLWDIVIARSDRYDPRLTQTVARLRAA